MLLLTGVQSMVSQRGQLGWIFHALEQAFQHPAAALAKQIADHGRKLDLRLLEQDFH
jgi:hypothetical protein